MDYVETHWTFVKEVTLRRTNNSGSSFRGKIVSSSSEKAKVNRRLGRNTRRHKQEINDSWKGHGDIARIVSAVFFFGCWVPVFKNEAPNLVQRTTILQQNANDDIFLGILFLFNSFVLFCDLDSVVLIRWNNYRNQWSVLGKFTQIIPKSKSYSSLTALVTLKIVLIVMMFNQTLFKQNAPRMF